MRSIVQIDHWPETAIAPLIQESRQEGFHFLQRLQNEWRAGTNRFSGPGEALFGVFVDERLLAIGGLNRQADGSGRLRRFYVHRDRRREGLGRLLVAHILRFASAHYARVSLRTDNPAAGQFYVSVGFSRLVAGAEATHVIELKPSATRLAT